VSGEKLHQRSQVMKSFHTLAMSDDEEAQIDKETGTLPWETVMCD